MYLFFFPREDKKKNISSNMQTREETENYSDRMPRNRNRNIALESRLKTNGSKYEHFTEEIRLHFKEIESGLEDLKSPIKQRIKSDHSRERKFRIPPVNLPLYRDCIIARASSKLTLSADRRTVTKVVSSGAAAVGTLCTKFSLRVVRNCRTLAVGFIATVNVDLEDGELDNDTGYYLFLRDGSLGGIGQYRAKAYSAHCYRPGTVITCEWQPRECTIHFYIDGDDRGVAFENVPSSGLLPVFDIADKDCCFELCENPSPTKYTGCTIEHAGSKLTVSADKRTVTRDTDSEGPVWNVAVGMSCNKFSFRVVRKCYNILVGFGIESSVHLDGPNFPENSGYYLDLGFGDLRGIHPDDNKTYISDSSVPGTVITCEWRPAEGIIRFYINGKDRGVAFTNIPDIDLLPVFYVRDAECCFRMCENP